MKKIIVMIMNTIITVTSKGQTTFPIAMRRKLGLAKSGGTLRISFNERKGEITISKPVTAASLAARISSYLKAGKKPLENVDEYYRANRQK